MRGTPRDRLEAAHATVAAARAALAATSVVGQPPPGASPAHRALADRRDELLALPGVIGVGVGLGADRRPVVSVFVSADATAVTVARPRLESAIPSVAIEIVPFHGLRAPPPPGAAVAAPLAMAAAGTVLAPGDGIGRNAPATRGTLGVFATALDGSPVGITAMHVAEGPGPLPIAIVRRDSVDDAGAAIGEIELGTRTGVDAARIRLAASTTPRRDIPTIGPVAGWRWAHAADIGDGVRLYGAHSGRLDGAITHVDVDFPSFSLERTIVAALPADHGDSGGALVDSAGYVLGFLVGASTNLHRSLRLFSPAGNVLARLECNIP